MRSKTPRTHTSVLKAKVALAAIREEETVAQLTKRFGIHATQLNKWKRQLLDNAQIVFDSNAAGPSADHEAREGELLKKIGELTVERDFLSRGLERRR